MKHTEKCYALGDRKEAVCREEALKSLDQWTGMKLIISVLLVQKSMTL